MQLIYTGKTNKNFNKDEEYHCTYLEIQEGQKAILKVQNKEDVSVELKYHEITEFIKNWRLIKNEK